ncbi:MAG: xanthine dehydrogenase family protein molybdopterin-binding subunit [Caldilineaceae bacterium]
MNVNPMNHYQFNVAAPAPKENMGEPAPRIDARLKVTGEARYPADLNFNNMAYGYLVTSAISRGRIVRFDLTAARAVPGVLEIFTHENANQIGGAEFFSEGGTASTTIVPLNSPRIWHDGQIIALVVAETYEAAREANYKVVVAYEEEPPSATFGSPGVETVPVAARSQQHVDPAVGDAEAAFADAAVTIDHEYYTPTQHHNPMELFSTTCVWSGEELTIYEPSQFVYAIKNGVAEQLGIDPQNVRAVSHFIGGGFGSKGSLTPRTAIVAFAARQLNRPVKLVMTRDQGYTVATYRAETRHHIRLGADRAGKIQAYLHDAWEITSRPDSYFVAGTAASTAHMYAYENVATKVYNTHADRNTPGFMRSPPEVPYVYAIESALDELAVALAMDPVELRRINDTMTDPITGKPYSSRALMACYDQAAAAFGWSQRNPEPGSMREGDWLIGWGCATAIYPTLVNAATARVRFAADNKVHVQVAAHDLGTGTYTVVAQMAANRLSVPLALVRVELGDSNLPAAPVSGGSNVTASVCSVVMQACDAIRTRLFTTATRSTGPLAGQPLEQLALRQGRIVAPDGTSEALAETFAQLGAGVIEEYAEWVPPGQSVKQVSELYRGRARITGGAEGEKLMYAFGGEFVEVRVNERTREIRVPRIVGAFAAGRIMNTRTARSQLLGGLIWGIGSALHEVTELDERLARYVNDNIAEYHIVVNADVPDVQVILVPEVDEFVNPAGVKGLGELANVGTAAAIANAVYHATGKRVRDLPIRIEKLL